ncbi:MAG: endonuclease/exonuclease/phosphatase [Sphingobacteriia bacterium]|nr:MAG: endonuclease/exonuclease/phosphatase [Sphingobacteriia bacterium]
MRYLLFLCGCYFLFSFLAMTKTKRLQGPSIDKTQLAFYNLENYYDTIDDPETLDDEFTVKGAKHYGRKIFEHKTNQLAAVLSDLGKFAGSPAPVLIGVAEIENKQVLDHLVQHEKLAPAHYGVIHFDSRDARGVDVALLFRKLYFLPCYAVALRIDLPKGAKESFYTRDILYVKGVYQQDSFHVLVNHWPSRRGGEERSAPARAAAAQKAKHCMDSIRRVQPMAYIILMGDLNDNPTDPSIVGGLAAKGKIPQPGSGQLFNPWVRYMDKGLGTLAHQDAWGLFDQILLSDGFFQVGRENWHFKSAGIYRRADMVESQGPFRGYPLRTWDGNRYQGGFSDHFPTYVLIEKISPDLGWKPPLKKD